MKTAQWKCTKGHTRYLIQATRLNETDTEFEKRVTDTGTDLAANGCSWETDTLTHARCGAPVNKE